MFLLNVLGKTSVVIWNHLRWEIDLYLTDHSNSLAWAWPSKKSVSKRSRKGEGLFRPLQDQIHSSYDKASCPAGRMPTSALDCERKCCAHHLCWSRSLPWKAYTKPAGFISLFPRHVNPLSFPCGKSSKVLGLLF